MEKKGVRLLDPNRPLELSAPLEPRRAAFKIIVRRIERPSLRDAESEFDWLCRSLGFFETIDRGKTASSLFRMIVKAAENHRPLTSTQLADLVGMSRGSVINHLNRLQHSGLIVRQGRHYLPRSRSVSQTIEEVEEDVERVFQRMKKIARDIDEEFGIRVEE